MRQLHGKKAFSFLLLPLLLAGCSSSNDGAPAPVSSVDASVDAAVDAGIDSAPGTAVPEASTPDTSIANGADAGAGDASLAVPSFVAHFAKAQGQLPEGLWVSNGAPVVGFAPLGALVTVTAGGTTQPLTTVGTASNTFTLGITSNVAGDLYVGVGAAATVGGAPAGATPVTPSPGVYAVPSDGGTATAFSLASAATPPMLFPNGLAFVGSRLFVADSEGVLYAIDAAGAAAVWSHDPLLAPSQPACGGVVPLSIGANGIAADAANVYVTNTNYGRVLQIPIQADGSAGTVSKVAEDCATLAGADGLAIDADGSFLVAVNAQNRIVRVSKTGKLAVVAEGAPLDTPASVFIDSQAQPKRLLVTNSSFFSAMDAGAPGLLTLPIP